MSDPTQPPTGPFGLLRRLVNTGLRTIQNRIELLGIELQEEKCRLVELLLWTAVVVFLAIVAVVVLTIAVAYLAGESARPYVLLGAGVLYAAAAVTAVFVLRNKLTKEPPPLAETVAQIKKDREWLDSLSEK